MKITEGARKAVEERLALIEMKFKEDIEKENKNKEEMKKEIWRL
jgi:ribosome-associated translation inhibitor RaiA